MKGEAVCSLYAANLKIVVMLAGIEPRISALRGRFPTLRRKHQIAKWDYSARLGDADKKGEKTEDGGDAYGTCTSYSRLERAVSCC